MPQQRFILQSSSSSGSYVAEDKSSVGLELLQEQSRIKSQRRGYVFNLMVAGRSGLGKSTLVNTLFKTQVSRRKQDAPEVLPPTTQIHSKSTTISEKGVKLFLTVTDTPGFGDQVNNENCWEPLLEYIEDQYSKYLEEEQKLERPFPISDTRVHCCLYFIQPSGHALSSLDVEVLQRLSEVVNVVPVIAKADSLTLEERKCFKERIRADLIDHKIKAYPKAEFEDKEDGHENSKIRDLIPFAVIGSTNFHEIHGRKALGRRSNWGFVDVENRQHSDFPFLRDMLIRTHMVDLVEVTSRHHFEHFRTRTLKAKMPIPSSPLEATDAPSHSPTSPIQAEE